MSLAIVNPLTALTGKPLRIGRCDCYTLANEARKLLGRDPLDLYTDYAAIDYSAVMLAASESYTRQTSPSDGDIIIAQGWLEAILGTYCDGMVLLFNTQRVSALVPYTDIHVLGIYGDKRQRRTEAAI